MKTNQSKRPPSSLHAAIYKLKKAVEEAKNAEIKMNIHLGRPVNHGRGSLGVSMRLNDFEIILEALEK